VLEAVLAVAVGVSLSACAGLRAFLPLLASGLLARTGHFPLHEKLDWLASTPALIALGVATLVEVAADKIPALDHALDVAQTPVRTVSGFLVAMAAFAPLPTWAAALLAIVAGATTALSVHAAKATVRAGSTATTAGAANPFVSLVEDVACTIGSVLAPLIAFVAVILALVALAATVLVTRTIWRRLRAKPAVAPGSTP
jgi:hypothetical protein